MDERTERRVLQKMEYVQEAAAELATIRDSTDCQEYKRDRRTRAVVEREFQTAIEACIDIGELVLSDRGVSVPDSNAGVFRALGERGVLDETVTGRMVRAAKFRNVLAHRYGPDIDDDDCTVRSVTISTCSRPTSVTFEYSSTTSRPDSDRSDGEQAGSQSLRHR